MVVSPDVGGVQRARAIAKTLGTPMCIVDKRRPKPGQSVAMNLIGTCKDKLCLVVDDMADTIGTLSAVASALMSHGAKDVLAYATHPVLSGSALDNLTNSPISELAVTNTIVLSKGALAHPKIRQISLAPMLSECVHRLAHGHSISALIHAIEKRTADSLKERGREGETPSALLRRAKREADIPSAPSSMRRGRDGEFS